MNTLRHFASRLPLTALLLPLMLLATSCSRYNDNGSLSIAGVIYLILAIAAVISLLKQDWSLGKKLIWGVIIWFFPIGGSIIYFLFSGRK
ncbi:PLD nuclease N-terminal domain-containing protein [Hymenobacter sp. 5317J-9]|uniref:PLDc_N domain-containing protein n=1 Tax=Hymenobacter armeniacus TaxID=2771358 RepID=A0ABR8JW45_9BACT|nr:MULTISPECIES: PLD nuclease N-terminal domain-containing protein [Hymenobacter]MBD2723522.1 PLDc_N domain-containing protein [Hymenobacter armeniacus]MBJ6107531.1 PLDc_N domain-containing protein [Hymenobacter sp. BT523]UOQ98089.1 PLD nuclease N-terminal domain-containing protein [Hymenobacter sp. 5317J-9]